MREITDGTAKFKVKDGRQHHCLGEIVALISTPPDYEHLLECNGQTISAEDYPELVDLLGSNIVPNLNGRVLQGSSTPNTFIDAGLPNITGYDCMGWAQVHLGVINNSGDCSGAFTGEIQIRDGAYGAFASIENARVGRGISFDASRSNAIYGKSDTVQPPAYTVKYYICYQS